MAITRIGPWASYDVFHMMHPQAVMMSQTGVSGAVLSAIQMRLGAQAVRSFIGRE